MENRVVEPKVAEEEPMAKAVSSVEEEARCIERRPKGEVEPTPSVPPMVWLLETTNAEVEALVMERFVVVALVVVALMKSALRKCEVEEA